MKRRFYHLSRAWYKDVLENQEYIDEVTFGLYCEQGGTTGEMAVRWYELISNELSPRLECFSDAWYVLSQFKDIIDAMAEFDDRKTKAISPEEFCRLLIKCGFEDLTPTERK